MFHEWKMGRCCEGLFLLIVIVSFKLAVGLKSWLDLVQDLNLLICWYLLKSTGFSIINLICSPVGSIYYPS